MRLHCLAVLAALIGVMPINAGEKITVDLAGIKSDAPAGWKSKPTPPIAKNTRLYTFAVPKAEGDEREAEIQVIFFGAGSGGGIPENLARWKKMFDPPEGKSIDDVAKLEKLKVGKVDVIVLDVQGTYLDKFPPFAPDAKTIRRPEYRRINVIFDSDNGPFFIIFMGPAKTVAQQKKSFDDWLKSFK